MPARTRTPVVTVLLLAALGGCSGQDATLGEAIPAVGGAPTSQPRVDPEIGQCRALDSDALSAVSDDTRATDCQEPHTTITYAVGDVEGEPPFDDTIKDACRDGWLDGLGVTEEQANLTIFSWAWYMPSAREYAEGARAYRCDLVANNTGAGGAVALPAGGLPLLRGDEVPDAYALCRTATGENVACQNAHAWRAAGTFEGKGEKYPSGATVKRWAAARCPALITTDDGLFSWPGSGPWTESDDHTIYCWEADRTT